MKTLRTLCLAGLLAGVLAACAKPLPSDKSDYAGEWHGGQISLVITPDGRAIYERRDGSMSKKIDAPLKEFHGDNFVIGVGFMSTEFVVSRPPHQEDGVWKMTVDGVEVTRVDGMAAPAAAPGSTST